MSGRRPVYDAASAYDEPSASAVRPAQAEPSPRAPGALIMGRYRLEEALGTGGMACVYRAVDVVRGREVAVKHLLSTQGPTAELMAALFEREFHALAELAHPRVIEVYDFGIDEHGSFYTMELLDGGDLRDRMPCDWREACALLFDVCSALALVHSRRMVHGDVTPRNVRCTRQGHAKLIDFGALAPIGRREKLVGTPAFVAPELVLHGTADARADLYSVGATLYMALTGELAYRARDFRELSDAWQNKPPAPSYFVPEIPPALDSLVLSLLEVDKELRPRSAFEVMQRLAVLADFRQPEHAGVAQAYLSTPSLAGRAAALEQTRALIERAEQGSGGSLLISGVAGVGRTRMLDACVITAKTLGAHVVRLDASDGMAMSGAQALVDQLCTALPVDPGEFAEDLPLLAELRQRAPVPRIRLPLVAASPAQLQSALSQWVAAIAAKYPVVIAVDDLQRVDEFSSALFANLAHAARRQRLLVIATLETAAAPLESIALKLFAEVSAPLALAPLTPDESHELLLSIFGDVPNLHALNQRMFARAQGNPREVLDLLQHLVDTRRITYEHGAWTLPAVLADEDLPAGDVALRLRLQALSEAARSVIAAHALTDFDSFTHEDYYALLRDHDHAHVERTIGQLVADGMLTADGLRCRLAHRELGRLLMATLDEAALEAIHLQLVYVYERRQTTAPSSPTPILLAKHQLAAGLSEAGVSLLLSQLAGFEDIERIRSTGLMATHIASVLDTALRAAEQLARPPRELAELRHWLVMLSASAEPEYYFRAAPTWLAQLEHDSGLCYWRRDASGADAGDANARLTQSLIRATEAYNALPESERVYRPDEAIKHLVRYVVVSIAVAAKLYDGAILAPLPALLEPYAALSSVAYGVWQNAIATCETFNCQVLQARKRWLEVLDAMPNEVSGDLRYVVLIRHAVMQGIALIEARIGLGTAIEWIDRLSHDQMQAVTAMYTRKIVQLQSGDVSGADECRKRAELLAVQATTRPLHEGGAVVELIAHALAKDIQGVKQISDRIAALADRYAGWMPFKHLAQAQFDALVGDAPAALAAVDRCLSLVVPSAADPHRALIAWPAAVALRVELLTTLGRVDEAVAAGERALAQFEQLGIDVSAHPVVRALALAEGKQGALERAQQRMNRLIAAQLELGVQGLQLGVSYEAMARVAAMSKQQTDFDRYATLSASVYRAGSALSVRYATMMFETHEFEPDAFDLTVHYNRKRSPPARAKTERSRLADTWVERTMSGAHTRPERALAALQLMCAVQRAHAGELYLCGEAGTERAAVLGQIPAAVDVGELVEGLLEREVTDAMATQAPGEPQAAPPRDSGVQLIPLRGRVRTHDVVVGVAALFTHAGQPVDRGRTLVLARAIAARLLQSGDVRGRVVVTDA